MENLSVKNGIYINSTNFCCVAKAGAVYIFLFWKLFLKQFFQEIVHLFVKTFKQVFAEDYCVIINNE